MSACRNCGTPSDDDCPVPDHCGSCPPWRCDDCGGMDSLATPCVCWVSLDGMVLTDMKALFATSGMGLSVES